MDEEVCSNCIQYQPNWRYCPLVDLFMSPDSSCEEFIAKKVRSKMENKTCGECRFFESKEFICCSSGDEVAAHFTACYNFEPMSERKPTAGDKIRQMNNTDLAEMLVYPVKPMNINGSIHYEFTSCLLLGKSYPMREQAVFLTERRLNAPEESEVKDE